MRNWKEYFNNWLLTPLVVNSEASAKEVLKVLSCHPIFDDETAKDYFVHPERANERMGKFRIWGDNMSRLCGSEFQCQLNFF